ncbi:MAG: PEP-CTERM sorting domain-containing protein [Burkholderiaceae bacterium]
MHTLVRNLLIAAGLAATANAFAVTDPHGDFLPSFTGQHGAAFDIVWADVAFDAVHGDFLLHATLAGPLAGTPNAAYVFGFDLGGTPKTPFGAIGEPGVAFTSTVTLHSNGTGAVGGNAVNTRVDGDDIWAIVPTALLPTNGITDPEVTWALWSIDSSVAGLARNADFAPDGDTRVSAVPEPAPLALMGAGLGLLAFAARRRRVAASA